MQIKAIKTRVFEDNEDLFAFIVEHIKNIPDKSVLVVTSKIVALGEGRIAEYNTKKQKDILIKKESRFALKTKIVWLTIKDGMLLANAGIDESNVKGRKGKVILLPKDSFESAMVLRKKLIRHFNLKNLGIVITDSRLMPLRAGAIGVALGYSGFKGIRNYIGAKDIFGRVMKISQTDVADSLATSAVLCMGEGKERQPIALITDAPVVFSTKLNRQELFISIKRDIYAPLFNKFN